MTTQIDPVTGEPLPCPHTRVEWWCEDSEHYDPYIRCEDCGSDLDECDDYDAIEPTLTPARCALLARLTLRRAGEHYVRQVDTGDPDRSVVVELWRCALDWIDADRFAAGKR